MPVFIKHSYIFKGLMFWCSLMKMFFYVSTLCSFQFYLLSLTHVLHFQLQLLEVGSNSRWSSFLGILPFLVIGTSPLLLLRLCFKKVGQTKKYMNWQRGLLDTCKTFHGYLLPCVNIQKTWYSLSNATTAPLNHLASPQTTFNPNFLIKCQDLNCGLFERETRMLPTQPCRHYVEL
jgi:hypothetical protein